MAQAVAADNEGDLAAAESARAFVQPTPRLFSDGRYCVAFDNAVKRVQAAIGTASG